MRATTLLLERVNQKLPSEPIVIAKGWLPTRMGKLLELGGLPLDGNAWEVGGAYAEREQGEAEGKFGSECLAKGGEYARIDSAQ